MSRKSPSEWLAENTYLVAGALAVICILAVGAIALSDQLRGTERWCYRALDGDGDARTTCRDGKRSCTFERRGACDRNPGMAVTPCFPTTDEPPPLSLCSP